MSLGTMGLGTWGVRQDTMQTIAPAQQRVPLLTAGTSPVTPRGNPIGIRGGVNLSGFGTSGTLYGKASLGFIASLIVLIVLAYMWTRNEQGGG